MIFPALAAAALLVFIFDFTSFGVILVLGGPRFATLETEIYYQTVALFDLPTAAVLALVQLLCTLALTVIYTRFSARLSRPADLRTPKVYAPPFVNRRAKLAAVSFLVLLALVFAAPLAGLAFRSVSRLGAEPRQTPPPPS